MKDPIIALRFKNELLATKVIEDRIREIQAPYLDKYVIKTYLLDDKGDSYGFTRTEGINFSKQYYGRQILHLMRIFILCP